MATFISVKSGNFTDATVWGLTATECCPDTTFDTPALWQCDTGNLVAGGLAKLRRSAVGCYISANPAPSGASVIQPGRTYTVTYEVTLATTGSFAVYLGTTAGTARSAVGTYTEDIVAGTGGALQLRSTTSTITIDVTSLSVKLKTQAAPGAGDGFTVSSGHTVDYNQSSATEYGSVTVNGTLNFLNTMSTKLVLAQAATITGSGTVNMGTLANPIPKEYTCEVICACTTNGSTGFNSATLNLNAYGDPTLFGDIYNTTIADNWTSGQAFTVWGDVSAWAAGQMIHVHIGSYSAYNTDTKVYTIASAVYSAGTNKTTITINEAAPGITFTAGGYVLNATRNVKYYKNGEAYSIGVAPAVSSLFIVNVLSAVAAEFAHMYRPRWASLTGVSFCTKVIWRNHTGFYTTAAAATFTDCLFPSSLNTTAAGGAGCLFTNCWFYVQAANVSPYYSRFVNCKWFSCSQAAGSSSYFNEYIGCDFAFSLYVFNTIAYYTVLQDCTFRYLKGTSNEPFTTFYETTFYNCWVWGGTYLFDGTTMVNVRFIGGGIGWSPTGTDLPQTTRDYIFLNPYGPDDTNLVLVNVKLPTGGLKFTRSAVAAYWGWVNSQDHGQVAGAVYRYHNACEMVRNTSILRSGGASETLEVIPLSGLGIGGGVRNYHVNPFSWAEVNVPATPQTRTIYIYATGWSGNFPTQDELYLEADYFGQAGTNSVRAQAESVQVLSQNSVWTAFTVTFTPGKTTNVRYRLFFSKYAASCKIYVDGALYNGLARQDIIWKDGEPMLDIKYSDWAGGGYAGVKV